jgi:putative glutamine amidotransferase
MAIIGISGNLQGPEKRILYQNKPLHLVEGSMVEMVENSGHTALVLPVHTNLEKNVDTLVSLIDGLILSGGTDVSSELYDEELLNERWKGQITRDKFEIALLQAAREKNKPVLGVCRGFQIMNVAYGGSLYQDVLTLREGTHVHRDQELYDTLGHPAHILKESGLYDILQKEEIYVNSVHHQGIKRLGDGLEIMAYSDDGLIEAIRDPRHSFIWGIQWHLEWMPADQEQQKIYQTFLKELN